MNVDPVLLERISEEVVACILNRPEKCNALSIQLMQQLCAYVEQVQKDRKVRVLVLRGNGRVFSAGLDLGDAMDPSLRVESAKMVRESLSTICRSPLVTIALVQGPAIGGGAGLVAACDFAVAGKEAVIGFPEVHRGLVAAQVMSVLVRKIKRADIKELLLSGEPVNAERALQMGLFSRVGDIETEAQRIITVVLRGAPQALAKTKRLLDALYRAELEDDIDVCMLSHIAATESEEAGEGMRAFLEKSKPAWDRG